MSEMLAKKRDEENTVPYREVIVKKPWGHEYLCYQNETLAIWFLFIRSGEKTSLHCHPNKNTGFVVLNGEVELSFLRNSISLRGLEKIHIFRGRFHSTQALSESGAFLLEIETPEDKHDLVRLEDAYGRQGHAYEGREHEAQKTADCLWIEEPNENDFVCQANGCKLRHFYADRLEKLTGFADKDFFVISRGGLVAGHEAQILWPGDVIDGVSLERLSRAFSLIRGTTMLQISLNSPNDVFRQ
jgi:mannose-6-phosphate isomerase-like protein (cupin superfamily)